MDRAAQLKSEILSLLASTPPSTWIGTWDVYRTFGAAYGINFSEIGRILWCMDGVVCDQLTWRLEMRRKGVPGAAP